MKSPILLDRSSELRIAWRAWSRRGAATRRGVRAAGALVAAALLLTACGTPAAPSSVERPVGVSSGSADLTAASENATAFRFGSTGWGGTVDYNPYSAYGQLAGFGTFIDLPLAYVTYRPPTVEGGYYYPELATSWKTTKSTVTLNLRKNARWQDGSPFTSSDALTSLLLAGGEYNNVWGSIASASAPNSHTLTVKLQPWAVAANVLLDLLQLSILPASQYGPLIPTGFQSDLLNYWKTYDVLHPTLASEAAAQHSAAGRVVAKVDTKISAFDPKTMLGDGPFELVRATTSGALFKKWAGWWDAKVIRMPYIEVYPMDSQTEYGAILHGRIDEEMDSEYLDSQVTALNRSQYGHYFAVVPTPVQQAALIFHFGTYPFGLLKVRQAFAYLIDRERVDAEVNGGKYVQEPAVQSPDGLSVAEADKYIGAKKLAGLKHYNYSPAKAAALLKSAGFTKRGSTWYTPKGTPFAFTIYEPAGYTQFDQDGLVVSKMLNSFGIRSSVKTIENTTYYTQQAAGDYPVSENFVDFGTINPLSYIAAGLLGNLNYPVTYNGKGSCHCQVAIGIGPVANVPGLGKVNIASALNRELNTAPPSEWGKYAWDWVRFINQNLPFLSIYNNSFHVIYATSRYTDFPPEKKAWMWTMTPILGQQIVWQQQGYLKLRH